jgi:hypothetical protein
MVKVMSYQNYMCPPITYGTQDEAESDTRHK